MKVPTLIVTGPVGVGKTTVANEMGLLLLDHRVRHATVDFDQLTACYPRPLDDDRWGTQLGLRNLAGLWRNYRRAGARRLIVARVIESRGELDGFRRAIPGAELSLVRLRASIGALQERVRGRGQHGPDLQWHLERAAVLAAEMDMRGLGDLVVETDGRDPTTVGREILERSGWLAGS